MKALVVGSGAREHAIAWHLRKNRDVEAVFVAPGNAGTAAIATNLPIAVEDLKGLGQVAVQLRPDMTVVGPEGPLAAGIVDQFQRLGLPIFGPTKAAARIESSKAHARELMERYGIPGPQFKVFRSYTDGYAFLSKHIGPLVVKADGLAFGKGSLLCQNREEAINALYDCMKDRIFGAAGDTVVAEEYLEGQEVSVFAFADGPHTSSLIAACDYKRLIDGDRGPNTGGMGSYSPPEFWTPALADRIQREIMGPVVRAMAEEGTPYRGVLYAGLMLTADGPKVLEFNCRLGDPEAQVILPLLETDLLEVAMVSIEGRLASYDLQWKDGACVGVVMTARGYPGDYRRGNPISGLSDLDQDVLAFHGGTRGAEGNGGALVTNGGRILTIVGQGSTLALAREKAYQNLERIQFEGAYYRKDIALLQRAPANKGGG